MEDECKRCRARDKDRARRTAAFYRRVSRSFLFTNDSEFWGQVIERARLETGIDLSLENWRHHSHDQHEAFGRACKRAQRALLAPRRRNRGQAT